MIGRIMRRARSTSASLSRSNQTAFSRTGSATRRPTDVAGALYLIRHGQTPLHSLDDERLRGWLDVGLAAGGIVAARRASRVLQPLRPARLFTSDLTRAHDTARIMSVVLGLPVEPTRNLRPWHVGAFAGEPVALAGPKLEAYMTTRSTGAPPQGEPFRTFLQRWRTELKRLLALRRNVDEPVVAVTHARNVCRLSRLLCGEEIPVKGPP